MSLNPNQWFTEAYEDKTAFSVKYGKKLFEQQSDFQKVEVYETDAMGRALILDGCFMVTQKDNFIYHEMLTHPAMSLLRDPKKVVVIGGGDGGTVTELVKYPGLESIILCEIDPLVVSVCTQFMPEVSVGLSDPRAQVINADGAAFIAERPNQFDLVLVDSTDPVGPGVALYEPSFYQAIKKSLKPGGAVVLQTESPIFMRDVFKETVAKLKAVFGKDAAAPYLAVIPSYPGALWSFTMCGEGLDFSRADDPSTVTPPPQGLKYFSPEILRAAFTLPPFVKDLTV